MADFRSVVLRVHSDYFRLYFPEVWSIVVSWLRSFRVSIFAFSGGSLWQQAQPHSWHRVSGTI